ncbi:MAG: histidine phosphatase family protein [Acidimicrobiia bacterium]
MELILVRHGIPVKVEGNVGEPPADPPLSEVGVKEAEAIGRWLAEEEVDLVVASPLRRARETAAPIAARHRLEVTIEPDIAEFDKDSPIYIPLEELKKVNDPRWIALAEDRWHELAGVDRDEFKGRVVSAIDRVVADNPGRRVVIVAHGGVINMYTGKVLGLQRDLWFEPAYCSISRILASRHGISTIGSLNETAHLRGLLTAEAVTGET